MNSLKQHWISCLALLFVLVVSAFAQPPGFLKVKILEGDGAFNDIKRKSGNPMSVEVRDQNGEALIGAQVTFSAPSFGPSGTFTGGSRSITVMTDMEGIAKAEGLRPNATEGRFNIGVTAHYLDREGSAAIGQTNSSAIVAHK